MCGICGIISPNGVMNRDVVSIKNMIGRIRHRGPDSSGYYRHKNAILGHARLAIIDVKGGTQPLCNEDGSLWITYNGEIYNYVELSKELKKKGHNIKTKSDTEVVIHAFEEWGTHSFEKFNGQWALAIWNTKTKTLTLSRDRFGIRPLYYTYNDKKFLFASEMKALFVDKSIDRSFDIAGLAQIYTFWTPVAPRTIFKNIFELNPGHYAQWRSGKLKTQAYWQISFPAASKNNSEGIEENSKRLREILIEASRLRFTRSDVPVGAYLSGGIDSSVTSSIINNYTQTALTTYSIRFTDAEFDEGKHQIEMVNRLGTSHNEVMVSKKDIGKAFPSVIWHTENPILRTAPVPLYLLSKLVHESGFKVVVTGEGADEVLAGYDIFREAKARLLLSQNQSPLQNDDILSSLYPWMKRSPNRVPAFAHAFFKKDLDTSDPGFSHRPRWNTTSMIQTLLHPDLKNECNKLKVDVELLDRLPAGHVVWEELSRAQWLEYTTLLSGYILSAQGDRMLMAHSVEGRFPFLDPILVNFANNLPADQKLSALDEKHILKVACKDLIPQSILKRPKQPYRAPDAASFFFDTDLDWVEDLTSESNIKQMNIFNTTALAKLINKCRKTKGLNMSNTDNMRITGALSTILVHHHYIEKGSQIAHSEKPPEPMTIIEQEQNN